LLDFFLDFLDLRDFFEDLFEDFLDDFLLLDLLRFLDLRGLDLGFDNFDCSVAI